MTEQTKQRLRERFEEILNASDKKPRTIADIEQIALQVRDQVAHAAVEEIGKEAQEQPDPETTSESDSETASKISCPQCQHNAWYKGDRTRSVVTLAGVITYCRRYFYCRRCHHGSCPLDTRLELPEGTRFTTSVVQEVACLCACLPFEQATQMLHRLTKVRVSSRTAERLCLTRAGQQADDFIKERDCRTLPLPFIPSASLPTTLPEPEVLYIATDGIQTPVKGRAWKEMKIGVVRSEHFDGREDQASRYVHHLGTASHFGSHWESLAIDSGSLKAKRVVVLGDGASWLWNQAQMRFPRATQILDFWHALEYVGKVSRDAFGEESEAGGNWLSARASEMKASAWKQVFGALEAVRSTASESVDATLRYFHNNAERMDYACYLRQKLSIGSGIAESSCKRLVTQRLKGSGMHWSERGAQAICSLRCRLLGGEWEDFVDFWNRQVRNSIPSPLS